MYIYIYDILEKVEISCFTFAFRVFCNDSLTKNSANYRLVERTMLHSSNKQIYVDRGK